MTCGSFKALSETWVYDHWDDLPPEIQFQAEAVFGTTRKWLEREWAEEAEAAVCDRWREFVAKLRVPA